MSSVRSYILANTEGSAADSTGTGTEGRNTLVVNKPRNIYKKRKPRPKTKEHSKRQAMLNTHRVAPFKYDLNEIITSTQMDESKASSFTASVIAKATRISTKDAKDFVRTFVEEGDLTKEETDRICRLLDRYSKYR